MEEMQQYTLMTIDGETVVGAATSEVEALDLAKKWYPEDFFVNVFPSPVQLTTN